MEEIIESNKPKEIELYPENYFIKDGFLYKTEHPGTRNAYPKKLCNFLPWISKEIMFDDGAVITRRFCVQAIHRNGLRLDDAEISSEELCSLNWVIEKWGAGCIIEGGNGVKEDIRVAMQNTSFSAEQKTVYAVTGWKQIDGKWHYRMPGREKVTVRLDGKLKAYSMPEEYSKEDLLSVRQLLESRLAPPPVLYSLFAYAFLSPLNEFLRQAGFEPNFVFMLLGRTGTRKSTLSALFLSFFGNFRATNLPLSFRDTSNSIITNAFALKDVLTCIDDFHPGSSKEENTLTATAQAVMRAYGDRSGRARLNADCTPAEPRPPQGNAIITAENPPDVTESGTARYLPVELHDGDVNLDELTEYQKLASDGVLRRCMYAYTEWLRTYFLQKDSDISMLLQMLASLFVKYRDEFTVTGIRCHGRVPEITAWLRIGMYMFLWFMDDSEILGEGYSSEIRDNFKDIVFGLAKAQSLRIDEDKPTHIFIRKFYSLMESNQITVLKKNTEYLGKDAVCYEDDVFFYFNNDAIQKTVKKLCDDLGESFTMHTKSLLKALADEKLIETSGASNTKSVRVGGQVKRMVCLYKEKAALINDTLC